MSELNELATEYLKISQELKEAQDKMKVQRDRKKALNDKIVELMNTTNKAEVSLSSGTIKLDKKKKPEGVNKKSIMSAVSEKYGNNDANEIADLVMKNRPKKEALSLKVDT